MTDHEKFLLAQKCINEIEDFLEYAYRGLSGGHVREIVMQTVDKYAASVSEGQTDA